MMTGLARTANDILFYMVGPRISVPPCLAIRAGEAAINPCSVFQTITYVTFVVGKSENGTVC